MATRPESIRPAVCATPSTPRSQTSLVCLVLAALVFLLLTPVGCGVLLSIRQQPGQDSFDEKLVTNVLPSDAGSFSSEIKRTYDSRCLETWEAGYFGKHDKQLRGYDPDRVLTSGLALTADTVVWAFDRTIVHFRWYVCHDGSKRTVTWGTPPPTVPADAPPWETERTHFFGKALRKKGVVGKAL